MENVLSGRGPLVIRITHCLYSISIVVSFLGIMEFGCVPICQPRMSTWHHSSQDGLLT